VIAHCYPFLVEYINIAKNGVLPNLKLQAAVAAVHGRQPIYFGANVMVDHLSDITGNQIRMVLYSLREIAKSEAKRSTCLKKASTLHKTH